MKVLLVTSEVTYVPGNYQDLFEELAVRAGDHLAGLVILRNLSWKIARDVAGLRLLGCRGISGTLTRNIWGLRAKAREKLFEKIGKPVLHALTMNDPTMVDWVNSQKIDLIVNVRTRCIYKKEILQAPRLGCLNIHHGILPDYRGTLCDLYALWEGRPAGFTIHVMNEKIDAGQILVRKTISREGEKDYLAYLARTGHEEGVALAELIHEIARSGSLPEGIPNRATLPIYTRNPDRKQIRALRKEGVRV